MPDSTSDFPESVRAPFDLMRQAWSESPVSTAKERKQSLTGLLKWVQANEKRVAVAIDADFGGRSHHETRLELEREQAHVLMGWKGLPLYHPQSAALGLASACLNGQGGRLFMELREKRGWAYQVGAGSEEGLHHGVFNAHIAVAPELVAKARDGLEAVLRTLAEEGPSEEELAKAKRFLLGGRAMSRQSSGARAMEWGHAWLYGEHPIGGMARADQRIQDCSAEQVQAALNSTLSGPSVVVFAGGLS